MKRVFSWILAIVLSLTLLTGGAVAAGDTGADGSAALTFSDAARLIRMLLTGQTPPDGADVNNDGVVNLWDVISILHGSVGLPPASASDAGEDADASPSDAG